MFLNPKKAIEHFRIMPGMKIADFGAGRGDFSFLASNYVGGKGAVYALDIKRESLDFIHNKAKADNLKNIHVITADLEYPYSTTLKNESAHCIIISNTLFHIDRKENTVREAYRVLESEGKLFFIDLRPEAKKISGSGAWRLIPVETAKQLFEIRGFDCVREFPAGDYHYGLVFKKI